MKSHLVLLLEADALVVEVVVAEIALQKGTAHEQFELHRLQCGNALGSLRSLAADANTLLCEFTQSMIEIS